MTPTYLFLDAVVNRHARMANRLEVEPASEFAKRIVHLPATGRDRAPSFMDRTLLFRQVFGGAS